MDTEIERYAITRGNEMFKRKHLKKYDTGNGFVIVKPLPDKTIYKIEGATVSIYTSPSTPPQTLDIDGTPEKRGRAKSRLEYLTNGKLEVLE